MPASPRRAPRNPEQPTHADRNIDRGDQRICIVAAVETSLLLPQMQPHATSSRRSRSGRRCEHTAAGVGVVTLDKEQACPADALSADSRVLKIDRCGCLGAAREVG